jgi:hypothetical protein
MWPHGADASVAQPPLWYRWRTMPTTVVPLDLTHIPTTPAGVVCTQQGSIVIIDVPVLTLFHRVPVLAVGLLAVGALCFLSRSVLLGMLFLMPVVYAFARTSLNRLVLTISPNGVGVVERGPVPPHTTRSFSREDVQKLTLQTVIRGGLEQHCSLLAANRVVVRLPSLPATFIAAHIKHGVG